MRLIRRAINSYQIRGPLGSLDHGLTLLADLGFDLWHGTDTRTTVKLRTLSIDSRHRTSGVEYQPTRVRLFRKVLRELAPSTHGGFVDFGSGKGRTLLEAAKFGFRRVVGVEFSGELCSIARSNVDRYRRRTRLDADIRVLHGDAADYEVADDDEVFYLFNPFGSDVLEVVLDRIAFSVAAAPRDILIVYHHPRCRAVLERHPFFTLRREFNLSGARFLVYADRPRYRRSLAGVPPGAARGPGPTPARALAASPASSASDRFRPPAVP